MTRSTLQRRNSDKVKGCRSNGVIFFFFKLLQQFLVNMEIKMSMKMLTNSTQAGKKNRTPLSVPANNRNGTATMYVTMDSQRGTTFVIVSAVSFPGLVMMIELCFLSSDIAPAVTFSFE